jgi:hypothetical protein
MTSPPPPPNQPPNEPPGNGPSDDSPPEDRGGSGRPGEISLRKEPPGPGASGGGFGPPPEGFGPAPQGYGQLPAGGGAPPPGWAAPGGPGQPGQPGQVGPPGHPGQAGQPGHFGQPGQPGYGYPAGGYGGYGPPPGGGVPPAFGYPATPPPKGGLGGRRGRVAGVAAGVLLVLGIAAGVASAVLSDDGGDGPVVIADSPTPSLGDDPFSYTPDPSFSLPEPSFSVPEPSLPSDLYSYLTQTPAPTDSTIPYVALKPGECFDTPGLDHSVDEIEKRSCHGPHDGQVIGNAKLHGTFTTESGIEKQAGSLCRPLANRAATRQADGRVYYNYVLHPVLGTYNMGVKTVSCSLTRSNSPGGPKLTSPLR